MRFSQPCVWRAILCRAPMFFMSVCLSIPMQAFAAHERPWAPALHQAIITKIADLPEGGEWHNVVTLPGGAYLVQRPAERGKEGLLRIDSKGGAQPYPSDEAIRVSLNSPTAITRSAAGEVYVVDQPSQGSAFIAQLDAATGRLLKRFDLPSSVVSTQSRLVAIAVHKPMIYLADEGAAALVTFDMSSQHADQFFAFYPTMMGQKPMTVAGKIVLAADGRALQRNISTLVLQNDGTSLYLQTPTGPLNRVSTALLRDERNTQVELMEGLTAWRGTPTVGGVTIGLDDTIYFTDRTTGRLLAFDTARLPWVECSDTRLTRAQTPFYDRLTHAIYVTAGDALLRISRQ